MTERPEDNRNRQNQVDEDEINLLDLLLVLAKNWKMIVGSMAVTFVLSCIYSLILPNIYTATATVFPPQQEKGGVGAMLAGMGDLAALAGIPSGGSSGELYVGILKSRTVADAVIDRFRLMEVYRATQRSSAYAALNGLVKISAGKKDGIISISVDDRDPQRAADMANAFVEELKRVNVQLNFNSAGRQRQFLENRLVVVRGELTRAEETLKEFQQKNKAIRIDDQATAIIDAIAKQKGELASKEVELGVLRSYQTEQNPQVQALREAIAQMKSQLLKLGQSPAGKKVADDIFIATSEVPELGVQYARLLREFKVQETLFELLTKQYEVAKVEEAKNTSTLQVLDVAVSPDRKSKPSRRKIVLVATVFAGFLGILWAFVREHGANLPEEDRQRWEQIWQAVRWRKREIPSARE